MPDLRSLVSAPRRALSAWVGAGLRGIVSGDSTGTPQWVLDMKDGDDAGYFGPGSAVWAVHGDLATLVGGIRALLVQALHPAAIAGVDQHSTYRADPLARLAGTTRWLTVTTFGSRAAADREAARVRGMHRKVRGTYDAGDGEQRPYRADEERLLLWVHAAFTDSFLATHEAFAGGIPGGADAYVGEWATAAELVGATAPPRSRADLDAYMADVAGNLAATEVTRRTLEFLRRPPLPVAARAGYAVLLAGAVSTLRPEHRELLGLPDGGVRVPRAATGALLTTLRTLLSDGPPAAGAARRRLERLEGATSA
ncbi:oxygenase MpaB family protein [Kineosporia sp. R_H_3]|uniref:oxygenase MpaB family protein n=1 Tax=Kineosporia sp. R_H_3 TaxID=1961848 RepID=UPI000B4AF670|nr:oxygenase MpaB family protein [Kineosporia sp. R_H_3]